MNTQYAPSNYLPHIQAQASQLSVPDQLTLLETLWDGIVKHNAVPAPTQAQLRILEQRLAEHEANPEDVISWEAVKASALQAVTMNCDSSNQAQFEEVLAQVPNVAPDRVEDRWDYRAT